MPAKASGLDDSDSDDDGLDDGEELSGGTDPSDSDSDDDNGTRKICEDWLLLSSQSGENPEGREGGKYTSADSEGFVILQ